MPMEGAAHFYVLQPNIYSAPYISLLCSNLHKSAMFHTPPISMRCYLTSTLLHTRV